MPAAFGFEKNIFNKQKRKYDILATITGKRFTERVRTYFV